MDDVNATYVYCVIAAARPPRLTGSSKTARVPHGLARMGRVRFLEVGRGLHAAVADAPLAIYGEAAIARHASSVDWVSRAAVGHDAVVEYFARHSGPRGGVLPMKLFTLFSSDARALDHLRQERSRIDRLIKRVAGHDEWGIRVLLDRRAAAAAPAVSARGAMAASRAAGQQGLDYLAGKKAQRDAAIQLATRARATGAGVYDRLAALARLARRRASDGIEAQGATLLLDAAFLVARSRAASFRRSAAREAKTLPRGYTVTLTGPWPPYSFVQD